MANLVELCLKPGSQPSKEDFSRIMFPVKQLLGLALGLGMGFLQMTGIFSIFLYFALSTAVCYFYSNKFLEVDEDEVEQSAVLTEGLGVGFFCFMLSWVLAYSAINEKI